VRGGRDFDGRVGDGDRDRDRSRGGFSLGFYSAPRTYGFDYSPYAYAPSYSYAPSSCNPPGFFDQAGYWHAYPGCDANPYGY
jgi:hypothetical protein